MDECQNCGASLESGFRVCPDCGRPLDGATGADTTTATSRVVHGARGERIVALFVTKTGSGAGQSIQLSTSTDIGRAPDNHLLLSDPHVSAHHGRVRFEEGSFVYHDLSSRSGSWLLESNGERKPIKEPLRLMHGDMLILGRTRLVFIEARK